MNRAIFGFLFLPSVFGAPVDESGVPSPITQRKQVTVPTKTLSRYVGTYTMQGVVVRVTRENNRLFLQKNDGPRTELFAEADFQFFSKSSDEVVSFDGVTGGKAIIMKIVANGQTVPLYRVE